MIPLVLPLLLGAICCQSSLIAVCMPWDDKGLKLDIHLSFVIVKNFFHYRLSASGVWACVASKFYDCKLSVFISYHWVIAFKHRRYECTLCIYIYFRSLAVLSSWIKHAKPSVSRPVAIPVYHIVVNANRASVNAPYKQSQDYP